MFETLSRRTRSQHEMRIQMHASEGDWSEARLLCGVPCVYSYNLYIHILFVDVYRCVCIIYIYTHACSYAVLVGIQVTVIICSIYVCRPYFHFLSFALAQQDQHHLSIRLIRSIPMAPNNKPNGTQSMVCILCTYISTQAQHILHSTKRNKGYAIQTVSTRWLGYKDIQV